MGEQEQQAKKEFVLGLLQLMVDHNVVIVPVQETVHANNMNFGYGRTQLSLRLVYAPEDMKEHYKAIAEDLA